MRGLIGCSDRLQQMQEDFTVDFCGVQKDQNHDMNAYESIAKLLCSLSRKLLEQKDADFRSLRVIHALGERARVRRAAAFHSAHVNRPAHRSP